MPGPVSSVWNRLSPPRAAEGEGALGGGAHADAALGAEEHAVVHDNALAWRQFQYQNVLERWL